MKASELILKLQELIKEHGDIEVYHADYENGPNPSDSVEFETMRKNIWPHCDFIYIS